MKTTLTIKDEEDLFGKIGDFILIRYVNSKKQSIPCEVEVMGIDKRSRILVRIIGSDTFKVNRPKLFNLR